MGKASPTGGVTPMNIAGRYVNERERLVGVSDIERAWRKQWLQDQILSPNEPKRVPELEKSITNPIKRFYRWPLDQLGKALVPLVGPSKAHIIRYTAGKFGLGIMGAYWLTYYFMYVKPDWTRRGGWHMMEARKVVTEGDPGYPRVSDRTKPSDYYSKGFKNCTLNL